MSLTRWVRRLGASAALVPLLLGVALVSFMFHDEIEAKVYRDPVALHRLSLRYRNEGRWEEASALLHEAAERGSPEAMFQLATQAAGVSRQPRMVMHWLERASAAGHAPAMTMLAEWIRGGVPPFQPDLERAVRLHRQAARLGEVRSMVYLVTILETHPSMAESSEPQCWLTAILRSEPAEPIRTWALRERASLATSLRGDLCQPPDLPEHLRGE